MAMTPAMESIFANAQQNAASLIETATLAINAKVNTIEEAEAMIQELSSEAVKFNELLTCIMNAMRQVESGDMQKEEAAGIIAPAVKELKDKCTALKIANVEAPGDDITEDEIATLRELIIGAKAAAEDRLVAIRLCDDCKVDPEVENELNPPEENGEAFDGDVSMESYSEDIAIEAAFLASKYVNTTECKTAKALYQNAKKLYSMGSKEKALEYMKKAKSLYEGCLKKLLNESGKFEKAERTDTIKKNSGTSAIRHNVTRTDSLTFAIARSKLETKIDRCTAHILQWTTKAGKETYQQTLDQLKADREQAKAAKKAAKATENYEMEDNNMIDFTEAYESYIDSAMMEYVDYETATEGANNDARKMRKNYAKEIRKLAKEAKRNYKAGNYTAAKNMYNQCADLAKQLAEDVSSIQQTVGQVQIGNLLHQLKVIGSCLLIGGLITSILEDKKKIENKINELNKAGNSELSRADLNGYTRDIIIYANKMADKFKKLADKAAKGELNAAGATESFDYDEFMFACESFMDELQIDLDTDCAMEADGAEDGEADSPSTLASRVRGAFAKLRRAFKRGDKQEVEAAKKEADAAAKELADAAEAAPADKKEKYKKAAKIAGASVAATAVAVGLTMGGTAIYQKAKGQDIDPTALFKIAGKVTAEAGRKVAHAPGNAINAKKDKATVEERKESLKKMHFEPKDDASMLRDVQNDRRAATRKAMAKKAKAVSSTISSHMPKLGKKSDGKVEISTNSMGYEAMEAYDIYEMIMEAYDDAMNEAFSATESADEDLASTIESML